MQTTYTVTKGQQWDAAGARVEQGNAETIRYRRDGRYDGGGFPRLDHQADVEAAVLRVIASGQEETIVLGEHEPVVMVSTRRGAGWCNRCESYCYGDCRS